MVFITKLIEISLDKGKLKIEGSLWISAIIIAVIIIPFLIRYFRKNKIKSKLKPVKLSFKLGGSQVTYDIERNFQNIETAHRVYIELRTRKAAIEIEEDKDVITQIYDSWYTLFGVIRNELKAISGKTLLEEKHSEELTKNLIAILNDGLRPHLTEHQAKFRTWYDKAVKANPNSSPQAIQKAYPEYDQLIKSMKEVNNELMKYAEQLEILIKGKE